jgi:NADH:ubiquinone oxidoreductase subunit C
MLQFSDNSHPFKKNFPSIGLKEIFYDASNDLMIYQNVNIQF